MSNLILNPYRFANAVNASFIGANAPATATTVSWPSGTAEGDIACFFACGNSAIGGSGLTVLATTDLSGAVSVARPGYKVLTSGDVSSYTLTVPTSGGYIVAVFRGPTVMTLKNDVPGAAGSSAVISGFTKDAASKFVLSFGGDRDPTAPGYVSTWTGAANGTTTYFGYGLSYVESASYTNNASVTQPLTASAYDGGASLFELT
jgi:hypothetical protein